MSTNPKPKFPVEISVLIVFTLAAIYILIVVFEPPILPLISPPTPTVIPPTSTSAGQYRPEVIPASTDTAYPTPTTTLAPTTTPTLTLTPTHTPVSGPLPDLTVTGISNPICVPGHIGTTTGNYVMFTVIVRNIGHVATRAFGPFDVTISFVLGPRFYSLDEWSNKFNGVVGSTNPEITNLNPDEDVALKLEIDIKGNFNFGIQAVANSGANTIPESDTTNNTLIKYFSIYCY